MHHIDSWSTIKQKAINWIFGQSPTFIVMSIALYYTWSKIETLETKLFDCLLNLSS